MSGKISAFSRPTICRSRHHVGEQSESNACMKPSGISSSFVGRWYVRERSRRFTMESRSESCHEVRRVAETEVEAHAGVPNAGKSGRQRSRGTSSRYAYKRCVHARRREWNGVESLSTIDHPSSTHLFSLCNKESTANPAFLDIPSSTTHDSRRLRRRHIGKGQ